MRHVILRDDDTNALTPPALLEHLYRPFLDRGLPVNLSVIPEVRTDIVLPNGELEGFLMGRPAPTQESLEIGSNQELLAYLAANPGYHALQHGLSHAFVDGHYEFDRDDRADIVRRLERGTELMQRAGFGRPRVFVAPQDKLSRVAFEEVVKRFDVISCGWYEWRRVPLRWRLYYALKKARGLEHWRIGGTKLLSHPGCLLSRYKPYDTMFDSVKAAVSSRSLTVLVTHWWEYFPGGQPDPAFIAVLHQVADYLASAPDICVGTFEADPAIRPGLSA